MKKWYEELFENYACKYDSESFTAGTAGECDFIEKEIGFDKSKKIIDIGCGTGRHSIELASRGYSVAGIDLSESMLDRAREKAEKKGVKVSFLKHDARDLPFREEFDLAIMLCEGGFPLMETDRMNYRILKNGAESLKKGGKFIFTTLNGLFPIFNSLKKFHDSVSGKEDACYYEEGRFDLMTFRDYNRTVFEDDDGNVRELKCSERYYIPPEIRWLLESLGFEKIGIFGAKLGAFSRQDPLTPEDFEMLVVAEKINKKGKDRK